MSKILITGSNGQLGREIQLVLESFPELSGEFHDIDTLDITDSEAVNSLFQTKNFDFVVNCAAYTAVDKAESDIEMATLINAKAVEILALACKNINCKFIHVSTDYVFDGTAHKPYIESDTTNPTSVYGSTKLDGEKAAMLNPDSIVIRTSWLYSIHGNNFVKTMLRLGTERKQLHVIFDQVGTPTLARDLAQAIISIIQQTSTDACEFIPGIYHYSNEGVCSWYDFATEIMSIAQLDCQVNPLESKDYPTPVARPHYSVLNKSKIKTTFNLSIPYWKTSLTACIKELMN